MEAALTDTAPTGASALNETDVTTDADRAADTITKGEDPDAGKLFDLPRIKVDSTNPTVLKTAFSGSIEIERNDKQWAEVFNSLTPGKSHELRVTVFCAGGKKTHRRDSEGDVDAVVQVKSLIVTDIHDPSDDA